MSIYSSVFYIRQYENLLSCFSTLFDVEEFKIQKDFLLISELVNTENHFRSRSTPMDSTNHSLPDFNEFLQENDLDLVYKTFFTEYRGFPALLSEKCSDSNESPMKPFVRVTDFLEKKNGFWILGASYNYSSINKINDVEYGEHSLYEQSLKTGKICKRGTFFVFKMGQSIFY